MTEMNDAEEMTEELQEQANYAAVESAKDQLEEKKAKHTSLMARLEKRREAKRKQLQKRKSQTAQNIEGIEQNFEKKLQKQISDAKHVMAHLEGGVGESSQDVAADDEKWVELFDEASGQPYWWSKANGSTWQRPESVDNHVFHTVHSNKCTVETNKKHVQKFLRSNSMSHTDIENFTLKWIDEHASRTERLKNQELWEKTLQLEEKLAHEREKKQGADLQMMEQLASPTGQEVVPGQESSGDATNIVNAVFEPGPLGLEMVERASGGVIVKSVQPGSQAALTQNIRRAMGICTINDQDYSKADLSTVKKALEETPPPITMTFTLPEELNYITTTWQDETHTY